MIPTVEDLVLATGCKLILPDRIQRVLRRLVLTDRPGLDVAARWPVLESFRLGTWRGRDLQILNGAEKLTQLRLEGRRQIGVLNGLETCQAIKRVVSVNYSVQDTAPLRGLVMLEELKMMAARPTEPHGRVDFSDLPSAQMRRLWISNAPRIRHLERLLEMPRLREVRLIDCGLDDAATRMLESIPNRVRVQVMER
jgi:hypothetical protein